MEVAVRCVKERKGVMKDREVFRLRDLDSRPMRVPLEVPECRRDCLLPPFVCGSHWLPLRLHHAGTGLGETCRAIVPVIGSPGLSHDGAGLGIEEYPIKHLLIVPTPKSYVRKPRVVVIDATATAERQQQVHHEERDGWHISRLIDPILNLEADAR